MPRPRISFKDGKAVIPDTFAFQTRFTREEWDKVAPILKEAGYSYGHESYPVLNYFPIEPEDNFLWIQFSLWDRMRLTQNGPNPYDPDTVPHIGWKTLMTAEFKRTVG